MNCETTKHQNRAGETNKQSCKFIKKVEIGPESDRIFERRIWDIAATSISLCSKSRKSHEGIATTRGERSRDCKITCEHDQKNMEIEKEKESQYQWDCDRVVKGLPKTKWHIGRKSNEWNLNMNLTD